MKTVIDPFVSCDEHFQRKLLVFVHRNDALEIPVRAQLFVFPGCREQELALLLSYANLAGAFPSLMVAVAYGLSGMPVILRPKDYGRWLGASPERAGELLKSYAGALATGVVRTA